MRSLLAAATFVMVLGGGWNAGALVQWWTPHAKDCPTFDTEADCVAYCTAHMSSCGDDATCVSNSGPTRSPC